MSDPIDDKALDEYLKGGSLVSQRYRELGADEVPDDLNRRVLDQARAAVTKRPERSRNWMRWSAPVALAASAVLVLSIVIDSGVQQGDVVLAPAPVPARQEATAPNASAASEHESSNVLSDDISADPSKQEVVQPKMAPAEEPPAAAPPRGLTARRITEKKKEIAGSADRLQKSASAMHAATPAAPPPPVAVTEAQVQVEREERSAAIEQVTATANSQRPVVQDSPVSTSSSLEEAIVTGARRRDARNVGPRGTVRAASGQTFSEADEAEEVPRTYSDPEPWLEDIRQLRKDGETAQADREWERFRAAFPDYLVADDDLARKKK